jgi:Caspase domain
VPTAAALIIASSEYEDVDLRQLRAPATDAERLADVLEEPAIGGFEVTTQLNQPSHVLNLAIEDFFADRGRDDLLLLYVSSHGVKDDDGRLYFAATNTRLRRLGATAVAAAFVNEQMTRSRSRRIVLLLDCCYSGAFPQGALARGGKRMDIKERFDGSGRAVLTASSAMEYSFEGDTLSGMGQPSVFTSALVEGLETGAADLDLDGMVSVDELYDYVFDEVRDKTPSQTPGKWITDVQGKLYIARVRPRELPDELRRALQSRSSDRRMGAVTELGRLLEPGQGARAAAAREALERLTEDDSRRVSAAASAALTAADERAAAAERTAVVEPPPTVDEPPAPAEPTPGEPAPAEPAPAEPAAPPVRPRSRPWLLRPAGLLAAVVVLAGLGLAGAWLGGGVGGQSPPGTTEATAATPSTRATTATSAPTLPALTGDPKLSAAERKLLGRIPGFFSSEGSCRQVGDADPRDIQPGPPVTANLECVYDGGSTVMFSLFPSDSEMHEFFNDRLRGRDLRSGQGTPGHTEPWQLNYCDAPRRGTGRIYGNRNTHRPVDPVRSEVGWIRDGYAMYAYAFRPDGDLAAMYDWWSELYGPVDSYSC